MGTGDAKGKFKGRRTRRFEVDFTVPLQLEECLHRLHHPQGTDRLLVNLHYAVGGDKALFTAARYDRQTLIAYIEGTLERWGGTDTRIGGDVEISVNGLGDSCLWTFILLASFFVLMGILRFGLEGIMPEWPPLVRLFLAFGGLALILIVLYYLVSLVRMWSVRRSLIIGLRRMLAV